MSQKSLNKASTFTAGSIAASTVILAATLNAPRVSTTLAASTICDAPSKASQILGAAPVVKEAADNAGFLYHWSCSQNLRRFTAFPAASFAVFSTGL